MVIADLVEQGFVLPITSGLWAYSGQGLKRVLPNCGFYRAKTTILSK